MLHLLYALLATARSSLKPQRELALENLALRQQLAILGRETKRDATVSPYMLLRRKPPWQTRRAFLRNDTPPPFKRAS